MCHSLDNQDDRGGHERTQNHGKSIREVQDAQVLSCLIGIGENRDIQRLIDRVVNAVTEPCDACEEVHTHLGMEDQRHCRANCKEDTRECYGELAATNEVGNGTSTKSCYQRHCQSDDCHRCNQVRCKVIRICVAREDVVLGDVEQVGVDHPVATHHQGAAGQCVVEIRRVFRRTEGLHQDLEGELLVRFTPVIAFSRPDNDGDNTDSGEDGCAEEPSVCQPVIDLKQARANKVTDGLSSCDACTVEARDRASNLIGDAVRHRRDEGCQHDVVTQLSHAPQDKDHREGILVESEQRHRAASNQTTQNDPRGALAETRTRQVRESTEDDVSDQGDNRACGVDRAEHRFFAAGTDVF